MIPGVVSGPVVPFSPAMTKPRPFVAIVVALLGLAVMPAPRLSGAPADTLPQRLTDSEFWKLSEEMSEPNGYFRSDNLLSNELYYPYVMADLQKRVGTASVYLGVGPEQN